MADSRYLIRGWTCALDLLRASMLRAVCVVSCASVVFPLASTASEVRERIAVTEARLQELYRQVSPAIVRIALDEQGDRHVGVGVIVSADGHVATCARTVLWECFRDERPVFCLFPGGRSAGAVALGWSGEWQVALVKIVDEGAWPHVAINRDAPVNPGEYCAAFQYERLPTGQLEQHASLQLGWVTSSASPWWFTTSRWVGSFPPIFSLDGRLIGMTSAKSVGYDPCHTRAELLTEHWGLLVDGKNLDRVRFSAEGRVDRKPKRPAQQKDTDSPAEQLLPAPIRNADAATVSIRSAFRENSWSGIIISPEGHVATCAHNHRPPGEIVTVHLRDGREFEARILGTNPIADVCLLKITEKGEWPHAEMGNSTGMISDDPCWRIGYPGGKRLIAKTSIVVRDDVPWSHLLYSPRFEPHGGHSGGGLFDCTGRLVAVYLGRARREELSRWARVEVLREQWDFLSAGRPIETIPGPPLGEIADAFFEVVDNQCRGIAVEILCEGQPRVLGTIVSTGGSILTKASELHEPLSVRFGDGQTLPATIHKYSRRYDLAVLKVARTDLPYADWSEEASHPVGKFVAALLPGEPPRVGVVSHAARPIPVDRGVGFGDSMELCDTDDGLEVVEVYSTNPFDLRLRKGDVIRSVEGHTTPDLKSLIRLLGDRDSPGKLVMDAGDRITFTIQRGNGTTWVRSPLPASAWAMNESYRRSGFPRVYDTDVPSLDPRLCGGPLVDIDGRVVGITIACRRDRGGQTHVVPSAVARRFATH